jgi:hypothetical protein
MTSATAAWPLPVRTGWSHLYLLSLALSAAAPPQQPLPSPRLPLNDTNNKNMCRETPCPVCHLRSWTGCGLHAAGVMAKIPLAQQCKCKPVPGTEPAAAPSARPPQPTNSTRTAS